ncbi:MAG: DUF2293 domain-containing protein [Acidobacteria bacterium]|nr:DUF2293 domain-containing protein [Acidobacteriota bacterium]
MQKESGASHALRVFISSRPSHCDECREDLGSGAWILLAGERGALCLACADLDHLVFLPPGNATLTRRAGKYSPLHAVVLEWSRSQQRYERQGLLVQEDALKRAEAECLADAEIRERRRQREVFRRAELDQELVHQFARRIRDIFPGCPPERCQSIAEHACAKYSGRVGRSAGGKRLEDEAIRLAVIAHIRHTETEYDDLLSQGTERFRAREQVRARVAQVLSEWEDLDQNMVLDPDHDS